MRIAIVQPPRLYWAFINDYDNFMVPQGPPALAAVARAAGHEVTILDCLPMKMGWKSLEATLRRLRPDVVAAGENHAVYSHEVVKLMSLVKSIDSGIRTIVGGTHFAFLDSWYLGGKHDAPSIDCIVRGEGEETFRVLLEELEKVSPEPWTVDGVTARKGDEVVRAPHRKLIADLDTLPRPAYDLLPMRKYGNSKFLFAAHGSTIHHSRGCPSACNFCAFWINMADHKLDANGEDQLVARWRTKSVERTIDEIEFLQRDFGKVYFVFVDDTFNVDPKWCNAFAEEVLKRGLKFRFYAFLRADLILRDEKLGVFEKLVRAGLIHAAIGVERLSDTELASLHKGFQTENTIRQCMNLLRTKYPQVFIQTTFLVGLREDTRDSIMAQGEYAKSLKPDYAGFHPLTPVPGTQLWREALDKGWINADDFLDYDWSTPVMETETLSLAEIDQALFDCSRKFVSVPWFMRGLVGRGDYTRRMYIWWLLVLGKMTVKDLLRFKNPAECEAFRGLTEPAWYNA